ncbi:MAG: metal-dependent hydrolase [Candidatus ainarchaeum sp.]|nr:metal-dependent hydrolase [Candidatus ainarchaeum sp.]
MAVFGHAAATAIVWLWSRQGWFALAVMLFFAYLADIDLVFGLFIPGGLGGHRGFTHSIAFAFIPLALHVFFRRRELLWGFAGALTHPAVDFLDALGAPLFWPATSTRYSLYEIIDGSSLPLHQAVFGLAYPFAHSLVCIDAALVLLLALACLAALKAGLRGRQQQ